MKNLTTVRKLAMCCQNARINAYCFLGLPPKSQQVNVWQLARRLHITNSIISRKRQESCKNKFKGYSTDILIPKITNLEYEKFQLAGVLRVLNERSLSIAEGKLKINKKISLYGWITDKQPKHFTLVDGYDSVHCTLESSATDFEQFNCLTPDALVNVTGYIKSILTRSKDQKTEMIILVLESVLPLTPEKAITTEIKSQSSDKGVNSFTYRTHTCGELNSSHIGQKVTLCGWLQYHRMSKFLLLRDSYGLTQCVLGELVDSVLFSNINLETVLSIEGTVVGRPPSMVNCEMATGDVEVNISKVEVLNTVDNIPFSLRTYQKPKEQLRLQNRYIDLRFPEMQNNLRLRSLMLHNMRRFLIEDHAFVEVETPTLFCRTPGGAREFVVPTRHKGLFYSLVQSPQQFKQMLMAGGVDRYFQVARCYRDETTRPDRQPEFTQLDIELSFTDLDGVLTLIEQLIYNTYPVPLSKPPFPRWTYKYALENYGSDKPNVTYGLKLNNISKLFPDFALNKDFGAYGIVYPKDLGKFSTKTKDCIKEISKRYTSVKVVQHEGLTRAFGEEVSRNVIEAINLDETTSSIIVAVGSNDETCMCLGEIRELLWSVLKTKGLLTVDNGVVKPLWVVDFPLFLKGDNGSLETCHHPFTAPHPDDAHLLENDPLKVRSLAYDLVINGNEIGGGSVRTHNANLQEKLLKMLDIDEHNLSHFLKALKSGCPPHAGIALGIDRMVALASGAESIRDVIAFPKSHEGKDPLSGAPNHITEDDKRFYNIMINENKR